MRSTAVHPGFAARFDTASKLDRLPSSIAGVIVDGWAQADAVVARLGVAPTAREVPA